MEKSFGPRELRRTGRRRANGNRETNAGAIDSAGVRIFTRERIQFRAIERDFRSTDRGKGLTFTLRESTRTSAAARIRERLRESRD
jgi:hypothetical protein